MTKLVGKESEIIMRLHQGEKPEFTSKPFREALKRLKDKGLVEKKKLSEQGVEEAEWRTKLIKRVQDVYDIKAGGGYIRDIHFVYEPMTAYSYAWNWCGRRGVSIIKFDPKRKEHYFDVFEKKFWLGEKALNGEELTFNMPNSKDVDIWVKGSLISMDSAELWKLNDNYFHFFLDFKEPAFYDALNLAAFQSWLLIDTTMFNSCFFIVVKGAYGGGKSVSCEAVIYVSCHGKVASPSIAYLGRSLERLRISVFIDEFDIIIEQDPEIGRIARMCQRRGQFYDRSTKSGIPQSYKVFGPWTMSVHGEVEDALATRSIPITVQETADWEIPVANILKVQYGKELYTKMWMWYLDSIDHISHEVEAQRNMNFSVDSLLPDLIVAHNSDGSYVTVDKTVTLKPLVTQVTPNIESTNYDSYPSKVTQATGVTKVTIDELRRNVAESILSNCTEKQKKLIKSAAGRNVELMTNCFKIANIIKVDCDESISRAFEIKKEVEDEEREIGLTGHLRDFLVKIYKDRRDNENYWTKNKEFMVSNKECTDEFTRFLHRREQSAVGTTEFKRALRELGFVRPTSRRRMKIMTWKEIEEGTGKKHRPRLANIYNDHVQRRLELAVEMPTFGVIQEILKTETTKPMSGQMKEILRNEWTSGKKEDFINITVFNKWTREDAEKLFNEMILTGAIAEDPKGLWSWIR